MGQNRYSPPLPGVGRGLIPVFIPFLLLLPLLLLGGWESPPSDQKYREDLWLETASGTHHFRVEIADTHETRQKGLMFVAEMAPNHGMLFDFKSDQRVGFWMKNTIIPLDMIFATADGRIVYIAEHVPPHTLDRVLSPVPVRFVLELNGGSAHRLGLKTGDRINHGRTAPPD